MARKYEYKRLHVNSTESARLTYNCLGTTQVYLLTHKDHFVIEGIQGHTHTVYKYHKRIYTNETSIKTAVRKLRLRYGCNDFNYKKVTIDNDNEN